MEYSQELGIKNRKLLSRAIFLGSAVALVCLALSWSAFHTYVTLRQLQKDLLRNQAANISAAVEFAGRDLARIPASEFQRRVEDIAAENSGLAELAVVSANRRVLAHSDPGRLGLSFEAPGLEDLLNARKIYDDRFVARQGEPVYRVLLPIHLEGSDEGTLHQGDNPSNQGPPFSIAAVSLFVNSASFVARQGQWNLILTVSACGLLVLVTFYYFVALGRSLRMEAAQAREAQWGLLGRMSAALAHDIRNPLGAIKGLAQLLGEKATEIRASSYINTIVKESERLEKLVGDLLIFAKPNRPEGRSFALGQVLSDIGALFEQRFVKAKVGFVVDKESAKMSLNTDYDLLKRVLINVVENSLSAMPDGGSLRVSGRQDSSLKRVMIQVEDDGESLPDQGERLFEPFYTTRAGGTGLGLAISRQIIERLGGTIRLENRPVRGANCTILLSENS